MINHLVGYACDAIVADAAWCSATRQDLPVSVLREMAHSFLAHADTAEPLVEAIRAEALLTVDVVREFYRQGNINLTRGFPIDPPTALERTAFSFVFLAGSTPDATARNMRACYQHLVAIVDKPYSAAVQAESDRFLRSAFQPRRSLPQIALRTRDPMGYLLARMFLPALNGGHRKAAGRDATLRGMALFCAVQAYEREHGTPPARLAQLVPEYLPHVPLDPFDGKPFRYLPASVPGLPPKAWAVYSVGEDFTDDGGTAGSVGRSRGKTGNNLDLVWPSQDYPKPPAPAPPEGVPGP